jgi:hypothetical protein
VGRSAVVYREAQGVAAVTYHSSPHLSRQVLRRRLCEYSPFSAEVLIHSLSSLSSGTSADGQRFTTIFSTDAVIANPTPQISGSTLGAAGDDRMNNVGLIVGISIGGMFFSFLIPIRTSDDMIQGVAFLGISGVVLFWLYKRLKHGSKVYPDAPSRTNLTAGSRNGGNLKSFDGTFDPGKFVVERKPVPDDYLSIIPDMYHGSVGYRGGFSSEEGGDGGSTAVGSLSAGNGAGVAPAAGVGVGEVLGSMSGPRTESPPQTQPQYHYQKAIRHSPSFPGGNLIPTVPVSVPPSAPGLNRQNSQDHYARSPTASPPPHKLGGQYALMPAPHIPNAYVNPLGISVVPQGEESPPSTASPRKGENSTARLSFPYNSYAPPSSTAHAARPATAPTTTTPAPHPFAARERRRSSQLADSRTSVDLALAMGTGGSGKSSPSLNPNPNLVPTPSPRRYSFSTSQTRSHSREQQPHSQSPQGGDSAGEEESEGDDADDERVYYRGPPGPAAPTSSAAERGERHPHHSLLNAAGLPASRSQSQLQSQYQSQPQHSPSSYAKASPPPTPPYATTATPFIRREPSVTSGVTTGSNVNSKIAARNRSNVSLNQRRAGSAISSGIEANVGVVVPEPRNW